MLAIQTALSLPICVVTQVPPTLADLIRGSARGYVAYWTDDVADILARNTQAGSTNESLATSIRQGMRRRKAATVENR